MRTSILMWSTLSGAILGVFADALLVGVAIVLGSLLPVTKVAHRLDARWTSAAIVALLIAIPVVLSVLGYLEGELKTV